VFLDPGTKGGVVVLSIILFIVPFVLYNIVTAQGVSEEDAGRFIGVGFTVITSLLWASTYIFRVATKDMTYVSSAYLKQQNLRTNLLQDKYLIIF